MDKKKADQELVIDVRIVYQGKVYSFAFGNVLKWLLPLAVIIAKVVSYFQEAPP